MYMFCYCPIYIFMINTYCAVAKVNIYTHTMTHLHGWAIMWIQLCTTPISFFIFSLTISLGVITRQECSKDADCSNIKNSKCILKICTCLEQNLQFNETTGDCIPKIGPAALCNKDTDCSLYHGSVCDITTDPPSCKCPPGVTCQQCKLGSACDSSIACGNSIKGWQCTADGVQACNISRSYKGDYFCGIKIVGEICSRTEECTELNGICASGQCQCKDKTFIYNNVTGLCSPRQLGESCSSDGECSLINNATCTGNKCTCPSPFKSKTGPVCGLCVSEDLKYDSGSCKPKALDDPCSANTDCKHIANSACINGMCSCALRYGRVANLCRFCALGTACVQGLDCTKYIPYSKCTNQILTLDDGHCFSTEDCAHVNHSDCYNSRCVCAVGYSNISSQCIPTKINDACPDGTRNCPSSSVCSQGVCICLPNYKKVSNSYCAARAIGDVCDDASNQSCGSYIWGVCKGTCTCLDGYLGRQGSCVQAFGVSCMLNADCISNNLTPAYSCLNSMCACSPGYHLTKVCLFLVVSYHTKLYYGSDMIYEMRRRKPYPTLLPTQGIFNLQHHIMILTPFPRVTNPVL